MKTSMKKRIVKKKSIIKKKTRKNISQTSEAKIVETFLEMLNTVKLYHWKTHSYAQHKATDDLYSKLNENIDSFVETMLGKNESRVNLTHVNSIPLNDYSSLTPFKQKIDQYKQFLVQMDGSIVNISNNSDLFNIRDELLGNLDQFSYLLTFE